MDTPRGRHWSDFWRQGNLTSLPRGFADNYDGEFLQFWEAQFSLLHSGANLVDVCSGNGSIALLAEDYSRRNNLGMTVKAVDAASIDVSLLMQNKPNLSRHIQAIEFLPDTPLEDLRITAETIDLVTSQFGVEYTAWEASARNICSMLKPGGYFSMVCHSFDSKILREMEQQQAEYSKLAGIELFSADITIHQPEQFMQMLEQGLAVLYDIFQENRRSQLLSAVGSRLEEIRKLSLRQFDAGSHQFIQFREGINASRGIANDLLEVNHALRSAPQWYEVFIEAGLQLVNSGTLHYQTGDKAGSSYQFIKPGQLTDRIPVRSPDPRP